MKKYIIIASLLGLVSLPKTHAQINTNLQVQASINNQNPFIDASSQSPYASVGKGIVFPRTNLTTFKFKTDLFDGLGLVFPTAFDGMLVYNTHVEDNATIDDPATGSYTLDLKEGFYYFSNPNGDASGSLTGGRWKPLGNGGNLGSIYSQDGTLSGDRAVNLDNKKLSFTGGKIGINTTDPKVTLNISKNNSLAETVPQGVLFPKFSTEERSNFQNTPEGTLIYNTTKKCLEMYRGLISSTPTWSCTSEIEPAGSGSSTPKATATLGSIDLLQWFAMEYNGTYANIPESTIPNNSSISVEIPYSNATNGDYSAYERTFTLADKNDIPRQFKLSYPAGTITQAAGTITATLTNISGSTYKPQPQPIPTSAQQYHDLATVQVSFNGAGATPLKIQAIGGIPDRCFGQTTKQCVGYGANVREHDFIYVPITGPDGKTWLNNNLGAEYSRVDSPHFNPLQQATSKSDWKAYGSLFQWQRNPDGHELINWSSPTAGNPKYGSTNTLSNSWTNADNNQFITYQSSPYSWVNNSLNSSNANKNLWQSNGSTNPCPVGYHVPTHAEQVALHSAITGVSGSTTYSNSSAMWYETGLKLPVSGYRSGNDAWLNFGGAQGYYWESEDTYDVNKSGWCLWFSGNNSTANMSDRNNQGFSVRCLKD